MSIQTPDQRAYTFSPWRPFYPSDHVIRALVGDLAWPVSPRRFPSLGQSLRQPEVFGAWLGVLLEGVFLAVGAGICLVNVWHYDGFFDWFFFWMLALLGVALQLMVFVAGWRIRREAAIVPDGVKAPGEVSVRSLRRAALAGNDVLAPPVAAGGAVQAAPTGADTVTFRVTPPDARLLAATLLGFGVYTLLYLVMGVGFGIQFVVTQTFSGPSAALSQPLFWIPVGFALITGMGLWRFIVTFRKTRPMRVEARADGLHWRKHTLPWDEVRGWYLVEMNPVRLSRPQANVVYCIMGQHASLAWLTYPPYVRTGEPGQMLAQDVHGRVPMPLRDLTPAAVTISSGIAYQVFEKRWRLLATSGKEAIWRAPLLRPPATLLAFLLSVVILLGGAVLPVAQEWYFGGQLTQLEASGSAVHDPLTANLLGWTPTKDSENDDKSGQSFVFTSQGYVYLSNTCCDIGSLATQKMRDGLVEVTIRQHARYDLDNVGVIFRANMRDQTALAFTVRPSGMWELDQYTLSGNMLTDARNLRDEGLFGGIRQIHQGLDATNRLAVLMNGSSCSFFVNGQFVGGYTEDDLAQTGQIGVYVSGLGGPVTFSDLLIAPA